MSVAGELRDALLSLEEGLKREVEQREMAEAKVADLANELAECERKLARAKKMEAVGLLAGGVAHDLNNILSGIVSYPELLLHSGSLSSEHHRLVEMMHSAGLRAAAIVQDLLTVARGAASRRDTVSINQVVKEYLSSPEHQELLGRFPTVAIISRLGSDVHNVHASPVHVRKAVMNLVANAVEAGSEAPTGRVMIRTESRSVDRPISGHDDIRIGDYVLLTVSDNGKGISDHDLGHIFEPFYAKKEMGRSGTGLGLTIVWNTMQDHEGYIDVSTTPEGTCFTLFFPALRDAVILPKERTSLAGLFGNGERVLVVDDIEDQRQIACHMLETLGYRVEAVASGEEAVVYVEQHPVDLILLDMIMDPGINGRETYERIIEHAPGQKALIASGYSETEEVRAAQALGAGRFMSKPYTLAELAKNVREELER